MLFAFFGILFSLCPLLVLKPVFLYSSIRNVELLEVSLVRSKPRVCWREVLLHLLINKVKLHCEFIKAVVSI